MPYIEQSRREVLDKRFPNVEDVNAGELTYVLYSYIRQLNATAHGLYKLCIDSLPPNYRYSDLHKVVGALECARLEYTRRTGFRPKWITTVRDDFYNDVIAPYEDKKIKENGDVL